MRRMFLGLSGFLCVLLMACGTDEANEAAEATATSQDAGVRVPARPDEVLACLSGDATDEQVNELFERLSVPHESGTGTNLLDGIAAVSARPQGVAVEFEPSTDPDRRAEIVGLLEEPPVVAVRSSAEGCP